MRAEGSVRVAVAVIFYCVCSGSMLLVNKLAVYHIPSPALVTLCQFATASSVVLAGKHTGLLRDVDDFEWDKAKHFLIYVLSFAIGTWTNMKVLPPHPRHSFAAPELVPPRSHAAPPPGA